MGSHYYVLDHLEVFLDCNNNNNCCLNYFWVGVDCVVRMIVINYLLLLLFYDCDSDCDHIIIIIFFITTSVIPLVIPHIQKQREEEGTLYDKGLHRGGTHEEVEGDSLECDKDLWSNGLEEGEAGGASWLVDLNGLCTVSEVEGTQIVDILQPCDPFLYTHDK